MLGDPQGPVRALVVGGCDARENEFPSMLSLQLQRTEEPPTYLHTCGASVLTRHWALTAAHCIEALSQKLELVRVVSGTTRLYEGGTRHTLETAIMHPGYNPDYSWQHDIGLIKVVEPFAIDGVKIDAATLPRKGQRPKIGAKAIVVGWGLVREDAKTSSERLQKAELRIINQVVCRRAYKTVGHTVHGTNLCAGIMEGGVGACQGDSGGPLFVDGVLVGLTSFSLGCARKNFPDVLTRVSCYVDWIAQHVDE